MKMSASLMTMLLMAVGYPLAVEAWLVTAPSSRPVGSITTAASAASPLTKATFSTTALGMATWSDSRAVRDYQDFLSSGRQELEHTPDQPSVIVKSATSSNPVYERWVQWLLHASSNSQPDTVVTPQDTLPEGEYPIYIVLPPYEVNDFLRNLNPSFLEHQTDFCFLSGGLDFGNIEDVLKERGYCRDSMTQVVVSGITLLEFGDVLRAEDGAVNLGVDSYGDTKWAGECAACGKFSGSIAARLQTASGNHNPIRCSIDFYREWRRKMWERSVLDAAFHVIGAVRDQQPTTVADVALYYGEEVSDMVWEFSQLLRGWRALTLLFGFEERVFGVAEFRGTEEACRLPEEMMPFIWGNQVFLQSKVFVDYLSYAQSEKGLLKGIELPAKADEDFVSKMRPGNLRADGVV